MSLTGVGGQTLGRTVTPRSLICNYVFLSSNFCNMQALDFGWYLFLWAHRNTLSMLSIHSGERCETSKQGAIQWEPKSGEKLHWILSDIKPQKLGYHYLLWIFYISYTYEKNQITPFFLQQCFITIFQSSAFCCHHSLPSTLTMSALSTLRKCKMRECEFSFGC